MKGIALADLKVAQKVDKKVAKKGDYQIAARSFLNIQLSSFSKVTTQLSKINVVYLHFS